MTNTQLRFLSAAVLISVVGICLVLGNKYAIVLVGLAGTAITDELLINFAGMSRKSSSYLFSISSFIIGYIYFNFIDPMNAYFGHFINAGILINFILVLNLFFAKP